MPPYKASAHIDRVCERCAKTFDIHPMSLKRPNRGRFCSRICQLDLSGTPAERFWRKVEKTTGCWLWTAGCGAAGYGEFRPVLSQRTAVGAHRYSYELAYGPIRDGLFVCHTCDVRRCVRPDHLFLGTLQDNIADMMAKGRQAHPDYRGERHPSARLNAAQVQEIRRRRQAGESPDAVAALFGITTNHVSLIFHRRIWKHVL